MNLFVKVETKFGKLQVFNFIAMMKLNFLFQDEILLKGFNYFRMDGTTKASKRQRIANVSPFKP